MPKVETSLISGGKFSNRKIHVSLINGIQNSLVRTKRNSNLIAINENMSNNSLTRRKKIIKKLIRVQPANTNLGEVDNHLSGPRIKTRKLRRKLIIKKKKKRILNSTVAVEKDEHLQQATKPRSKLIITRKRLLPVESEYKDPMSDIVYSSVTNILSSSLFKNNYLSSIDHVSYDKTLSEEEFSEEYPTDIPEENITIKYEITSIGGVNELEITTESLESNTQSDSEYSNSDNYSKESFNSSNAKNVIDSDQDEDEITNERTFQNIPDYEPSFPEITESIDSPILHLKTTILSSVKYSTDTLVESRLRTFTLVITRLSGNEEIITSTTEVKPQVKTFLVTKPFTTYTTLTLLDFDSTDDVTKTTKLPNLDNLSSVLLNQDISERANYEEARYNLATRIMSNGVEVIVAGDKNTLLGNPDHRRFISTNINRPVTLKPSTLSDKMIMLFPQDASNSDNIQSSVYPDQFITKTCLTTFTYLTTYLQGTTTTVSSHEQVVSNVATEEKNSGKILPTPAIGITLTQYPKLSVEIFHTTYTYLNTILDGEQPLVVSSKHIVTNTVTAPDDYLSFLKPSETRSVVKDTNTYYSTIGLEKTLYEGNMSSVISTSEVLTQVIITESIPPKATSVMTSYIALDIQAEPSIYSTSDVVKTYFVTYTYYNTVEVNGKETTHTNISTSSDVVTEKIYIKPQKSRSDSKIHGTSSHDAKKKFENKVKKENKDTPTVISSSTRVVESFSTKTVDPNMFDKKYLKLTENEINQGAASAVKRVSLQNGNEIEVTAIADNVANRIQPSRVLPIEKTQMPEITTDTLVMKPSSPNIITGSTIVFVDDDPFAPLATTPVLNFESQSEKSKTINVKSVLSSEVVENTKVSTAIVKSKKSNKRKSKPNVITPSKTETPYKQKSHDINQVSNKQKQQLSNNNKEQTDILKEPAAASSNLLGLGSLNINSLQALTPVLNAMAGLITTNLKSNRRNDENITVQSTPKPKSVQKFDEGKNGVKALAQNRSPLYIPVGGISDDFEIAESQNIATFDWIDLPQDSSLPGKAIHETSLLNGGIPISPGDIITANSDVIVGKPGRIGPRIPSIPWTRGNNEEQIPLGMKPPPIPSTHWSKQNHEYKHIPLFGSLPEKQAIIIHSPNKNDYIGPPPPPPLSFHSQPNREDRIKPIVLASSNVSPGSFNIGEKLKQQKEKLHEPQIYAHSQSGYLSNEIHYEQKNLNFQEWNQNFQLPAENPYAAYTYGLKPPIHSTLENVINHFNMQSSIVNEPLDLPEIIERSTGQPLLVNLQPSQVALVNIPFNRTTALIYGGSTEPHRNGQYFDDPSPYPEPEFSAIEIKNGIAHTASVYQDDLPNQKQVNGVIKVGNQIINKDSDVSENQNVHVLINPSKTLNAKEDMEKNNHEIKVDVPPISFGLTEQANDFTAHVINHGNNQFIPPNSPYEGITNNNLPIKQFDKVNNKNQMIPLQSDAMNLNIHKKVNGFQDFTKMKPILPSKVQTSYSTRQRNKTQFVNVQNIEKRPGFNESYHRKPILNEINYHYHANVSPLDDRKTYNYHHPKYESQQKQINSFQSTPNIYRQITLKSEKPIIELVEYMTPPPVKVSDVPKYHRTRRPSFNRPLTIPLIPEHNKNIIPNEPFVTHGETSKPITYKLGLVQTNVEEIPNFLNELTDHKEDDNENEDGEVIQESISRPIEILNAKISSTTQNSPGIANNTIKFPPGGYVRFPENNKPIISNNARPFVTSKPLRMTTLKTNMGYGNKNKYSVNSSKGPPTLDNEQNTNFAKENFNQNQFNTKGNYKFKLHENQMNSNQFIDQSTKEVISNSNINNVPSKMLGSINTFTVSNAQTSQKPIFVYIDEADEFFHQKKVEHKNRFESDVTLLPIDSNTAGSVETDLRVQDSQTEKPFEPQKFPPLVTNEIIIKDEALNILKLTTETPSGWKLTSTTFSSKYSTPKYIGEVRVKKKENVTSILSDMEIMKPPPLVTESPKKQFSKLQNKSHTSKNHSDIFIRPSQTEANLSNIQTMKSQPQSFVHKHTQIKTKPTNDEVIGMNPPPLVTTFRPLRKPRPTYSTVNFKKVTAYTPPSISTERYRTRKPYTRRTTYFSTLTTSEKTSSSTEKTTPETINIILSTEGKTTEKVITPSPTLKLKPSMEVIIGNPNLNIDETQQRETTIEITTQKYGESKLTDNPLVLMTSESTPYENKTQRPSDSQPTTLLANTLIIPKLTADLISGTMHHFGNQVKLVDEITSPSSKSIVEIAKTRQVLPIRYITHTKTSTITVTETTVVKTLGQPPTTHTILVTKTETNAVVETVTEVRTIVKPTSIIETITTTVQQPSSLYPPEVYGSPYPSIQVMPTNTQEIPIVEATASFINELMNNDDLEDFIIHNTDPPTSKEKNEIIMTNEVTNKDTILVVLTDKNTKNIIKIPEDNSETQERDELITTNENNILLGGILIANRQGNKPKDKCEPECQATKNEFCQKSDDTMRCICRLGFARMFPDRPCLPTYTYNLNITLERIGRDFLHYYSDLSNPNSTDFIKFGSATREALDRMVMQSDLRDIFQGVEVHSFTQGPNDHGIISKFYLQLSDNIEETRLEDILRKYLRNNNYSLGGTDIIASHLDNLNAQDFDECSNSKFHDCSENAYCFNLKGTYTCSCKEGFSDLSENMLYPGRVCSTDQIGCERCNYHGFCYSNPDNDVFCECFPWYAGENCHINLKVLLIALVTLGTILFALLLVCIIMTCTRRKPLNQRIVSGMSFLPQRVRHERGTLDRRVMIQDTSSEDSKSETSTISRQKKTVKPKGALKKTLNVTSQKKEIEIVDQKDRSLSVMIPRAKYHPAVSTSPLMNYTTFDARKPSVPSVAEAKLLNYLDASATSKNESNRKCINAPSESVIEEKPQTRKTSGALISAGFEVSATVGNNMGALGTTCGTEADRSENATLIQRISADLLSSIGTRSQFNTLRKSLIDEDLMHNSSNWLDLVPRVMTISESRSYDETTIPPPMKSFRNDYDSKASSQHPNDEANTMTERDLGSTFLLPHTHLYKPDRGSDISGFESL